MSRERKLADEVDSDDCLKSYKYLFQPDILKGKVAFITGGGTGIGFRITELLMRHGCKAAIAGRRVEKVREAATKLKAATGEMCVAFQADVRNPQQMLKVVDDILACYGRLDILVNNAAGNFLCPAENLSFNGFKTVMEIDTIGTFNTTKAAFEKYFKNHGGNIINISATLAYKGQALQVHAGSAKAAIDAMTKHLAVEWGPKAIRINGIAPGPIGGTEGLRRLGGKSLPSKYFAPEIPLQSMGTKTEIGESVIYLASDASSNVTGTVLVVDGGSWLTNENSIRKSLEVLKSYM